MIFRMKLLSGILIGLALTSCTKDVDNNLDAGEKPLYITKPDAATEFNSYATFSLADSVAVISNNQLVERVRTNYDAALINAIAEQMTSRGYTRVAQAEQPDLGISISRIYNDYTGIIDYTDYWGDYSGYWDPYYWGYPGYDYYFPPAYGTYTVTEGGVAIDMFDLKNAAGTNQLRQVWSGLIRGTGTFNTSLVPTHAQALFQQSPYLAH